MSGIGSQLDLVLATLRELAWSVDDLAERVDALGSVAGEGFQTECLTVAETAQLLKVEPPWVYAHATMLQAIRLGSGPRAPVRIPVRAVRELLASGRSTGSTPPGPVARYRSAQPGMDSHTARIAGGSVRRP